jgi:hypothetical protein
MQVTQTINQDKQCAVKRLFPWNEKLIDVNKCDGESARG